MWEEGFQKNKKIFWKAFRVFFFSSARQHAHWGDHWAQFEKILLG